MKAASRAAALAASLTAPDRPVPTSGVVRLRVRYCECDPMNVAHHAAFIPWLEMGRTELLRDAGVSYAQLEKAGIFLVVTRLECRYRRPAFYDDLIEVRTSVSGHSRIKIEHSYEVVRVDGGGEGESMPLVVATSTIACVDASGTPRELPVWLGGRPPAGGGAA